MTYGAETWTFTKHQERKLTAAKLKAKNQIIKAISQPQLITIKMLAKKECFQSFFKSLSCLGGP